ncbi:MAG: prepilin-type N-terminal cleavage/methylation domain-containing protein [Candidatus Eremiobacterota bacterium]
MHRRGFTLYELLMAMALAALVLGLGVLNLQHARHGASSKALASLAAEEFRAARQAAVMRGHPVALVLSSSGGTSPLGDTLYWLEGHTPRRTRAVRFADECPGAALLAGNWTVDLTALRNPALVPTRTAPAIPGQMPLDLDAWLPAASKQDYCFVYLPDGSLKTNDLVHFDGEYHLLACTGATSAATGPPPGTGSVTPPPPCFAPSVLGQPWTITLTPMGGVRTQSGVAALQPGSVSVVDRVPLVRPARPSTPTGPNSLPEILDIQVGPVPNPNTLPPGVDVTVPREQHVTVNLTAVDADGDQLYCNWTADGGDFASSGEMPMEWDTEARQWRALWHWKAPPGGNRFQLDYQVRDARGGVALPFGVGVIDVQVIAPGKLFFLSGRAGGQEIFRANPDGGGPYAVTTGWTGEVAVASPDGTYLVATRNQDLVRLNADGSNPVVLTGAGFDSDAAISPDGTEIAWYRNNRLCVMDADGGNVRVLGTVFPASWLPLSGWGTLQPPCWSPDGQTILFSKWAYATGDGFLGWQIYQVPVTGGGESGLIDDLKNNSFPSWSPDQTDPWVYFMSTRTANDEIWRVRVAPAGGGRWTTSGAPEQLTSTPGQNERQLKVSPDGSSVVFLNENAYDIFRLDPVTRTVVNLTPVPGADHWPCWVP